MGSCYLSVLATLAKAAFPSTPGFVTSISTALDTANLLEVGVGAGVRSVGARPDIQTEPMLFIERVMGA